MSFSPALSSCYWEGVSGAPKSVLTSGIWKCFLSKLSNMVFIRQAQWHSALEKWLVTKELSISF